MTLKIKVLQDWQGNSTQKEKEPLVFGIVTSDLTFLGVLTKADSVKTLESFQRWNSIITGEDKEHGLAHGYYLTMQERLKPEFTWQRILSDEERFFEKSRFWNPLPQGLERHTGTVALRMKLSHELSRMIKNRYLTLRNFVLIASIPALIGEVNSCIRATSEKLKALPRPVRDSPHLYLNQICRDFIESLSQCIHGENDQKDLVLMIEEADRCLLDAVKFSVAQFGLANHDEKQLGLLPRTANEFMLETCILRLKKSADDKPI
jgi:hypothetical protein